MTDNIQQPSLEPTGKWTDMRTGDTVTVKTMVNDSSAGGAQIMFTDGTVIPFNEFSVYYIQQEDYDTPADTPAHPLNISLLTAGMGNREGQIAEADTAGTINDDNSINDNSINENSINENSINENYIIGNNNKKQLVSALIDNLKEHPRITIKDAIIENIPYGAISSLVKYFNISDDDVSDAIIGKFVTVNDVTNAIKDIIRNNIKENIYKKQ